MRSGFLARTGAAFGPLAVSFGYGGRLPFVFVLLSDGALTEIVASLDAAADAAAVELALIAVSDQPATDVQASHALRTVIELEDEET